MVLRNEPPPVKQTDEKRKLGHEGLVPESKGSQALLLNLKPPCVVKNDIVVNAAAWTGHALRCMDFIQLRMKLPAGVLIAPGHCETRGGRQGCHSPLHHWKDGEISWQGYREMKADYERQTAGLSDLLARLTAERKQLSNGIKRNLVLATLAFLISSIY